MWSEIQTDQVEYKYQFCSQKLSLIYIRIVGGSEAVENSWPWQVSIQRASEDGTMEHICGGTIYNYEYIITAAHCINKYSDQVHETV